MHNQLTTGTIAWPDYGNTVTVYPTTSYVPPYYCNGDTHTFACKHELRCKCGQTSRVIEPTEG